MIKKTYEAGSRGPHFEGSGERPPLLSLIMKVGDNGTAEQQNNKSHYQSKVIVSVSVISRHMQIIAQMLSIGS